MAYRVCTDVDLEYHQPHFHCWGGVAYGLPLCGDGSAVRSQTVAGAGQVHRNNETDPSARFQVQVLAAAEPAILPLLAPFGPLF